MFPIPEQFSTATKATLESQFSVLSSFAGKAFEGVEKLVELNLSTAKAALEESAATSRQLLGAKDAQEFLALSVAQAQPSAEKAATYSRSLAAIASGTQADLISVVESQFTETNGKIVSLFEEISKHAPAGSENAVAIIKSAIGNASAGYEQFTKTSKQAAEVIEANFTTAVNQFSQAADKAIRRA
jgi:phasin family protein